MLDCNGGGEPKATGRDLVGTKGRNIRVNQVMEEDFVPDIGVHCEPVEGYGEASHCLSGERKR